MKLRGIEFGTVIGASGLNGWFGEGYPYHVLLKLIPGFTFRGVTLTAKTTTLLARPGNMPLRKDKLTPREIKPRSIVVKPGAGVVLNAVGLSGPGLRFLLDTGRWQKLDKPFLLSFMSTGATREERLEELCSAVAMLKDELPKFKAKVGLQINFSCPNTGHAQEELVKDIHDSLAIASVLDIPLIPKISVLIPPDKAGEILRDPNCDAIAVSNTIAWADLPEEVQKVFFRTKKSPLARFGGGGISGKYLLPLVEQWLYQFKKFSGGKPVIAGGGILRARDVDTLVHAGANAVSPGSVVILRPWKLKVIIKRAEHLLAKK
jgi:dihydroorotate dehydrogenase